MEEFKKLFKKYYSSKWIIRRLSVYALIVCILLTVLIYKISETNSILVKIANNNVTDNSNLSEAVDIEQDTKQNIEDILPIFREDETTVINTENNTSSNKVDTTNFDKTTHDNSSSNTTSTKTNTDNTTTQKNDNNLPQTYVINKSSKKIHMTDCTYAQRMGEENKQIIKLSNDELDSYIKNGYKFCSKCGGK